MKKRLIISESDRDIILKLHEQEKVGFGQRVGAAVNAFRNPTQPTQQQPTTTQQPTTQTPVQEPVTTQTTQAPTTTQTTQAPVTERFTTAKCPGKDTKPGQTCDEKVLKLQVKINDKCSTEKLPVKLKEDGVIGKNTRNALTACESFIKNVTPGTPVTPVVNTPNTNTASDQSLTIDSMSV